MEAAALVPSRAPSLEPRAGDRPRPSLVVLSTAEVAPCTCPEACERDHDWD